MNINTHHANQRMNTRLSVSKKDTEAQSLEALNKGVPRESFTGDVRRWIDKNRFRHETRLIVWRHYLWIFSSENILITLFPILGGLIRKVDKQIKKFVEQNQKTAT